MFQNETIVGSLESKDRTGHTLVFTSARIIILKNRKATTIIDKFAIFFVIISCFFIFVGPFLLGIITSLIVGVPAIIVCAGIAAYADSRAQKTKKDYRNVTLESLLSLNHEEIDYSQIEKVELMGYTAKLFYIAPSGNRKKKQFGLEGTMYEQDVALLKRVLPNKVSVIYASKSSVPPH
jgi:hypothetical protein